MPTLAFNDLVIHPRDNDLVLATHGRGLWVLDNINAIQEIDPNGGVQLFSIADGEMINYARKGAHVGDMMFRGQKPTKRCGHRLLFTGSSRKIKYKS